MSIKNHNETFYFFQHINKLKSQTTDICNSLEELRNEFISLHFDDDFSKEVKAELNEHIRAMNTYLCQMYSIIEALTEMSQDAEMYTNYER
ncbi:MAG: hypothetical protein E7596_06095 [Ruminococcaceae bacterium]|nr:hypothetical protein [Oscillospiraceae bacterium]